MRRAVLMPGGIPSPDTLFSFRQMFARSQLDPRFTYTRVATTGGGLATDSIYTDAAGSSYNTFGTDVVRLTYRGVLREPARTNRLLLSNVPVTQTTASLATGTYVLWVIGTGSATSSAVTATGTGFGAATAGVPNVIVLTGAGTVLVTVAGSVDRFQLELGSVPSSFIQTAASTATRAVDILYATGVQMPSYTFTLAVKETYFGIQETVSRYNMALATSDGVTRAGINIGANTSFPSLTLIGGGNTVGGGNGGSITNGVPFTMVASVNPLRFTQVTDLGPPRRTAIIAGAAGFPFGMTHIFTGGVSTAGSSQSFGFLDKAAIWYRALNGFQAQGVRL